MKTDVMIKWMTAHVRVWNGMSDRRSTLVAMSTWGAEPEMCKVVLSALEYRRSHPPKTPWQQMQRAACEADVDLLDREAFEAFQREWFEAYDREHAREENALRRWAAFTPAEDD